MRTSNKKPVFRTLLLAILGFIAGLSYSFFFGFICLLYAGGGHGDPTPGVVMSIPMNIGLLLAPILFTLIIVGRNRITAIIGILVLTIYFFGLWINDIAGLLRVFSGFPRSSVFIFLFCAHLLFMIGVFTYFIVCFARGPKTLGAKSKAEGT
jgi:hypothetical protein